MKAKVKCKNRGKLAYTIKYTISTNIGGLICNQLYFIKTDLWQKFLLVVRGHPNWINITWSDNIQNMTQNAVETPQYLIPVFVNILVFTYFSTAESREWKKFQVSCCFHVCADDRLIACCHNNWYILLQVPSPNQRQRHETGEYPTYWTPEKHPINCNIIFWGCDWMF